MIRKNEKIRNIKIKDHFPAIRKMVKILLYNLFKTIVISPEKQLTIVKI